MIMILDDGICGEAGDDAVGGVRSCAVTCDIGGFLPECFDISESMSEADAA